MAAASNRDHPGRDFGLEASVSIKLGPAPDAYDRRAEQEFRTEMDRRDLMAHKRGRHLDLGGADFAIILYAPDGTRWKLSVDNSGNLTTAAA